MTYDFAAIGIGPFNLGLACLVDPIDDLDGVFLEREPAFDWHPGMLIETSTLQTPFLADLVTLADPTSRFSFLNYAKTQGHLYSFYIREDFQPLRTEYNTYCRWAADQLDTLRFGRDVVAVEFDPVDETYLVRAEAPGGRETYRARRLVLGTGTPPHVPAGCGELRAGAAVHSCDYLTARDDLRARRDLMVVGGGQSAAEIVMDLLEAVDDHDYALTWVTRSPRFFPLEYTKLTLELTSPEYVDYFHALPPAVRDGLVAAQAPLYKGIDSELIDAIFGLLYRRHRRGPQPIRLLTNTELTATRYDAGADRFDVDLRHVELGERFALTAEALVFATGYRYRVPAFLDPIRDRIRWDDRGRPDARRNYTIDHDGEAIFVQNAELHTHGFAAPDLGMAAYRNSCIIRELLGREHYPIERRIAMQEFGTPAAAAVAVERAPATSGRWAR